MSERLPCFKAYDVRGRIPDQLNVDLARQIGRAFATRLDSKRVVVGRDMRLSSAELAQAVSDGLRDMGCDVVDIGLGGTEMMYFASFHLADDGVDGGIMVTASHNPADYNGMKFVKKGAVPISGDTGLFDIEALARAGVDPSGPRGSVESAQVMSAYVDHLLGYVDAAKLKPLKVVENPGNGCAGLVIDALEPHLPLQFTKVHHAPDGTFPNGVPNPLLVDNQGVTVDAVREVGADLGIAWDGDFDRCFFFDETGAFIDGYYMVGLFARAMLERAEANAAVLYDPRLVWNSIDAIEKAGGRPILCKTGHAFVKERMRLEDAVYGGEMSAHHYFRDFAYCDSGMIPWLLMAEILSTTGQPMSALVSEMQAAYPASGEINRRLKDADEAIANVEARYAADAQGRDDTDGLSLDFGNWRFNLRKSNTEPVVRLNVESRGDVALMRAKTDELLEVLGG